MARNEAGEMTPIEWLICAVAGIGFVFDTYELVVLTLIARPALIDLVGATPGSAVFNRWIGMLFYIPAVAGGTFGLLGGYLIDRFGRKRILVWSIFLYCFSALAAGFVTSGTQLLILRSSTFVGVSVEFVAATAWLAELFTNRERRESVLGYAQGFSAIGGILVSGAYYLAVTYGPKLPAIHGGHEAWRYTLMSGIIPAIPLVIVRPFLPESPIWKSKRRNGTLQRPSIGELFRPEFRRTSLLTCLMMACAYAVSYGALQHIVRIVPGTPGIRSLPQMAQEHATSYYQGLEETGGMVGRFLMAFLAVRLLSRRRLLHIFQLPGLLITPLLFLLPAASDANIPAWATFLAGLLAIGQFSFWGNYLPLVFPTHLRGTGESFAANIGGRMLGTSAALLTTTIVAFMPGGTSTIQLAYAAGTIGFLAYAIGFAASFWLPEPSQNALPE